MAKRPKLSPDEKAIVKRASQGKGKLMALPTTIKPEWEQAGRDIAAQRRIDITTLGGSLGVLGDETAVSGILAGVDAGLSPQQAGNAIGLHEQTIRDHLRDGELDIAAGRVQTARAMLVIAVKMANDRRRMRLLGGIEASSLAGPQFWTAGAWLLERGYGADYKLQSDLSKGQVIVQVGVVGSADVRIGGESVSIPDSHPATTDVVDIAPIGVTLTI